MTQDRQQGLTRLQPKRYEGILSRYQSYLPLTEQTPRLGLSEGDTPLLYAERLSKRFDLNIYLKLEGMNPTGSFKDRGMVMAVAKAIENGSQTIICASTGNTSASAAAYAARANIQCVVLVPDQNIALGKLAQAMIYGAKVIAIQGNFDEALELVRSITAKHDMTLVNSVNPYRLEGQKTAAFEVCDQLGDAPDYLALPVGNAGNISAYWKGFKEYAEKGKAGSLPRMLGFEAEGAAAIVKGKRIEQPETIATAIRIGNPASWETAEQAANESKGMINFVSDEQILNAYTLLAQNEGVFAEPASAASLAGVLKLREQGYFQSGDRVVCVLTGNGLKDPQTALQTISAKPTVVENDEAAVLRAIKVE